MQQQLAKAHDARSESDRQLAEAESALQSQQRLVDVLREQCDREAGAAQRALALEARVQVRLLVAAKPYDDQFKTPDPELCIVFRQ